MKKLQFILLAIASAAMLAMPLSCTKATDDPEPGSKPLATPVLSIAEQTTDSYTITWEAIENAAKYVIDVNGMTMPETTETSYKATAVTPGSYTVKVKALPSSEEYLESEWGNITVNIEVIKLSAPKPEIELQEADAFTVVWAPVENARGYIVNMNGEDYPETQETGYAANGLQKGDYVVKVKALPSSEAYSESDWGEITVSLEGKELSNARPEAYYVGDYNEAGTGNGWINFIEGDIMVDDWGDIIGEGMILCVDFNTTLAENPDFATLVEGTYTPADESYAAGTLNLDGNSYIIDTEKNLEGEITGGSMIVKIIDAEAHTYSISCSLESGDALINFEFEGMIKMINHTEEGKMSNLESDIELSSQLTQGYQLFMDDAFGTGEAVVYAVILADDDYDADTMFGLGQNLMLNFNADINEKDGLPAGTYSGMIDMNTATSVSPFTCLGGVYFWGTYMGCWYFHTAEQTEAALSDGEFTVEKDGNIYTIKGEATDGYGHKITVDYTGELPLGIIGYEAPPKKQANLNTGKDLLKAKFLRK